MALIAPKLYLLDTNIMSFIVNGRSPAARRTMKQTIMSHGIATSAIVEGEILYGLAKKPEAERLRATVEAVFSTLTILPWDSAAARAYGTVRAQLSSSGKTLSPLDMLIAAHAVSVDAVLVTHDRAFNQVEALRPTVDWATDL